MPEFDTDTLLPPKHGVMTPFAKFAWAMIGFLVLALAWVTTKRFRLELFNDAGDYVKSARTAMAAKDLEQAAIDLSKAYQRAPNNREVIRQIIELMKIAGTGASDLLAMIEKLNMQETPSPELQLLMAQTLLRLGRVTETRQAWTKLPETVKSGTEALELMAGILTAEGQTREAADFARRAVLSMPDSPEKEFQLAAMDIKHPFPETQQKARQTLWKLAESRESIALGALAQLAADPKLTESDARKLLKLVGAQKSKPPLPLRLEIVSALVRVRPDLRNHLCRKELQLFRQSAAPGLLELAASDSNAVDAGVPTNDPLISKTSVPTKGKIPAQELNDELSVFCRWLAEEKQVELLLELAPLKKVQESSELFGDLARALAESKNWNQLATQLRKPKVPVNPILAQIWLGLAEGHLHPYSNEAHKLISGAIEAAGKKKDTLLLIAAALSAEQLNENNLALAAYQSIATFDEKKAVASLEESYATAEFLKDTRSLFNAAKKLHTLRPTNRVYTDKLAYLKLLCGLEIETSFVSSTNGSDSNSSLHKLLNALAAYRLGDYSQMKQHLKQMSEVAGLSVGQRAVFAGMLAKDGQLQHAFQIAEKIQDNLLLSEEFALLEPAL